MKSIIDGIKIGMDEFLEIEKDEKKRVLYKEEEMVEIGKGKI